MGLAGHGDQMVRRLPSDGRQRRERHHHRKEQHHDVISLAHRRRRPDRIRRACTLLACGWSFQSWCCTDGFTGSAWRTSSSKAATSTSKTATSATTRTREPSCATTSVWQQRRASSPAVAVASRSRRRASSATLACSQTGAASTLEVQENGGEDTQLGGAAWVDDDFDAAAAASSAAEEEARDINSKRGKQRKPRNTNVGRNKLFDLLNDLEGGGGCEAIDLLDIGGVAEGSSSTSSSTSTSTSTSTSILVDHGETTVDLSVDSLQQEEGEGAAAESQEEGGGGEAGPWEPLKRTVRRKFLSRTPPLTRSQAEEWRILPMAERIQELCRTKRSDPQSLESWKEAMQILAEVKEEHGEEGLGLTFIYGLGMRACLDFGHPEEALRLFREVKSFKDSPPNRVIFDSAIVAHCQLNQRNAAVEMVVEMKESGWAPTEVAYIQLFKTIRGTEGASAVADRVLRLYAEEDGLDVDGLLPRSMDICHQYLMVLARDKQWEQALDFFSQLVDRARPAPDQNCYDAVLYGLNRAERWVETVEVMDVLRQRLEESPVNVKPRRRLYLSALSTLLKVAKRDQVDEESEAAMDAAIKLWKEFLEWGLYEGIRPHIAAQLLHALFNACDKHEKHWPTAVEVFEMIETYEYDSVKDKSSQDRTGGFWGRVGSDEQAEQDEALVAPTAKEYGSMLHILSKSKDSKRGSNWERSMELLRDAQENEFPIAEVSFQTVLTDLGFASEVDLAFSIYDDMRMAGIPPSVNTYNRLLGVCEKNKQWDRAFKILDEMYELNLKPDVISFGAAISACGKGLQWRRALALLVRMQHDGIEPNLQCFNAVIHGLGLAGEWKRAEAIMEVIHKTGLVPDGYSYNSMAMAYASAGESDRALDVLETMERNGVQPDEVTYGTLMKACEGEGAFSIMRSLMDEMDQRGIPMTVNHYTTCIDAANRMEGTGMGWELWRQMGVKGVEPNNYAYSAIMTTAAIDRDVRTALRLLEEMKTKGMDIDVVSYTSAICACGPDWLLALDVLEEMAKDGVPPNLLSYTAAMGACFKGEEPREVINVFNQMKAAGVAPDLRAYNLAMMAHDADGNHHGRAGLEAELTAAGLSLQDKEWETAWVPPPELGGGYSEIGEAEYDVGPPIGGGGGGGSGSGGDWKGAGGGGGGGYGQFEDYEGDGDGDGEGGSGEYHDGW